MAEERFEYCLPKHTMNMIEIWCLDPIVWFSYLEHPLHHCCWQYKPSIHLSRDRGAQFCFPWYCRRMHHCLVNLFQDASQTLHIMDSSMLNNRLVLKPVAPWASLVPPWISLTDATKSDTWALSWALGLLARSLDLSSTPCSFKVKETSEESFVYCLFKAQFEKVSYLELVCLRTYSHCWFC